MSQKARTVMAKLRRQSRVRPYRERSEITPLLATTENGKQNGKANGTSIHMDNSLYPINEVFHGKFEFVYFKNSSTKQKNKLNFLKYTQNHRTAKTKF